MNRKIKNKKIKNILKTIFILLWILSLYAVHYYFEIKRYIAYVPEHLYFLIP